MNYRQMLYIVAQTIHKTQQTKRNVSIFLKHVSSIFLKHVSSIFLKHVSSVFLKYVSFLTELCIKISVHLNH
jgi:hypothetical protein